MKRMKMSRVIESSTLEDGSSGGGAIQGRFHRASAAARSRGLCKPHYLSQERALSELHGLLGLSQVRAFIKLHYLSRCCSMT